MSFEAMAWARKVGMVAHELGELNSGAVFVLWSLADRADENWSCFPSVKYDLAPSTMQTERSTQRHLTALRKAGLLATEARANSAGHRVGLRFYLLPEGLEAMGERLAAKMFAQGHTDETPSQPRSDNLSLRPDVGAEDLSDKLSLRDKTPSQIQATKTTPRMPKRQFRQGLSDNFDTKSPSAFKRNARALNHQSNHQSAPGQETFADWNDDELDWSVPEHVLSFGSPSTPPPVDGLTDGQNDDSVHEESMSHPAETEPVSMLSATQPSSVASKSPAAPVSETPQGLAEPLTAEQLTDDQLAQMVHRGVRLDVLGQVGSTLGLKREAIVWRSVADIVLDRATSPIRSPHQYVVRALETDGIILVAEAVERVNLATRPQAMKDLPERIECAKHYWSGTVGSVCPSCRADQLAGESEPEPLELTQEQIAALPEHAREMARRGFARRYAQAQKLREHTEEPVEPHLVGVAPWDE